MLWAKSANDVDPRKKMQNVFLQEQKGSHDAQAGLELFTAEGDREPLGLLPATTLVLGLGAAPSVRVAQNETSCLLGKYSSTKLYPPPAARGRAWHKKIVLMQLFADEQSNKLEN